MGPFFSGLIHPLTTPTHMLILLGLGLWLGQQQPLNLKLPVLVFASLSFVALLMTITGRITTVSPPFLIGIAMGIGILVALECKLPPLAGRMLFAVAAMSLGFDSAVEGGVSRGAQKTILGIWTSLVVLLVDIAFYVSLGKKMWIRVGIRVLGSWIVAISLLMLAFSLRK